jgi:hypothetical protein
MAEWPGVFLALVFLLLGMAALIVLLRPVFLRYESHPVVDDHKSRIDELNRKADLILALLRDIQAELPKPVHPPLSGTNPETGIKQ